jgi:hypothetical protein
MTPEQHIAAAPDGANCVTTVTNSTSGQPAAVISQFMEDKDGAWHPNGALIIVPAEQIPELINMLRNVYETKDIIWVDGPNGPTRKGRISK